MIREGVPGFSDLADTRHRDAPLGHGGQQGVDRVLRGPGKFFDVKEATAPHRLDERAVHEVARTVAARPAPRAGLWCPSSLAGVRSALPSTSTSGMPHSPVIARSRVDLLVPGGPCEQDVAARGDGREHQVEFPLAARRHGP